MSVIVADGVTLLSRRQSGLGPTTRPVGGALGAEQTRLRVHHGASKNGTGLAYAASVWRAYWDLHVHTNGWSDIGYSFGVARGDTPDEAFILTGRGFGRVGAHTYGHNDDLGVVLIGNGTHPDVLTPAVKRAFDWSRRANHNGVRPAFGHRDTSATTCPGDALYAWVHNGMPLEDDMALTDDDIEKIAERVKDKLLGAGLRNEIREALDGELGDESGAGVFSDRVAAKTAAAVAAGQGSDVAVVVQGIVDGLFPLRVIRGG